MKNFKYFLVENSNASYKLLYKAVIDFYKNYASYQAKITLRTLRANKRTFGDITLNDDSLLKHKFSIAIDYNAGTRYAIGSLLHELTHTKQVVKGELSLNKDRNFIVWKGKEHTEAKHYNNLKSYDEYSKLPWEKEAINNRDNLVDKFIESKYFKALRGKNSTLDFIIEYI